MKSASLFLPVLLPLAHAHFSLKYPTSRGDTTGTQNQSPCGGLDASTSVRTAWPPSGGSLVLAPSHPWTLTSVHLGLSTSINASTEFPTTLLADFNQTGAGTLCLPHIPIPADVEVRAGMNASMQIIQVTDEGEALYNCADITFAADAVLLQGGDCINSTGVGAARLDAGTGGGMLSGAAENQRTAWLVVVGLGMAVLGVGAVI